MRYALLTVLLCGCASPEPSPELMALSQSLLQPPAPKVEPNVEALEQIKALTPQEFDEIEQQTPELPPQCTCDDCTCTDCKCKPGDCHCPKPEPVKEQPKRNAWSTSHFWLTMYTEPWCGPCRSMKARVIPKLSQGIRHQFLPSSKMPRFRENPKQQIPFCVLQYWDGKEWKTVQRYLGLRTANEINAAVDRQLDVLNNRAHVKTVYAKATTQRTDIRSWIRQNYRQGQRLTADVSPRNLVWSHLTNDHGFTQDQVRGLSLWEALALHDAAHRGVVSGSSF